MNNKTDFTTIGSNENNNYDLIDNSNDKYLDKRNDYQLIEMIPEMYHRVKDRLNNNLEDYRIIDEDVNMPPVEKAIAKRKILAMDIGLGLFEAGGVICLVWFAKKIFES